MPTFRDYVIATRPWSFSMSAISVTLGTLIAWQQGPVHWGWSCRVAGVVLCHAAGNVLNDYFDSRNRVDRSDSATATVPAASDPRRACWRRARFWRRPSCCSSPPRPSAELPR